jgi:DNA polymerase I-like protein with 3'-5' exonuclease and polymerase domains
VMLQVRDDALARVARQVKAEMMTLPPQVEALNAGLGIPFAVDVKAGKTWRDDDMHDVDMEEPAV